MNEIFSFLSLSVISQACFTFSVESERPYGEGGVGVIKLEDWAVLQAVGRSISR